MSGYIGFVVILLLVCAGGAWFFFVLKKRIGQLEEKVRSLQRDNEQIASFSHIASHDLQEPLRKIQAFTQLIQARDGQVFSPVTQDYFMRIKDAAARMQRLIEDLLDFAGASANTGKMGSVDLNGVLQELRKMYADTIESKNGSIEIGPLPVISGNRQQMLQLFGNLLANSLKYSRKDTPADIRVYASKTKEAYWDIFVEDNGIGFAQKDAETIFGIFNRLHGKSDYPGSGIGLAIARKITDNHQGLISATGKPGLGAVFTVRLPV